MHLCVFIEDFYYLIFLIVLNLCVTWVSISLKFKQMKSIESFLFNIDIIKAKPYQGALLISEPFLRERYFNHSVICLTEYEKGKTAMGIVLNKTTMFHLQDLIETITTEEDIPIYCGGPLSCDRLFYIHTLGNIIPDSVKIIDGLYIGGNFDNIINYINCNWDTNKYIRFFIGYSGWDINQLDEELLKNVWAVAPINNIETLFEGEENAYWHKYVRTMGNAYKGWLYHPENPQSN